MNLNNSDIQFEDTSDRLKSLRVLDHHQILMIDEALSSLENFGELRLIVEKGKVRYLVTQISIDALKYCPGDFSKDGIAKFNSITEVEE